MQIGGLGIVTLTLFLLSLFVNLGLATSLMANKLLELESWKNIRHLLGFIIITTLTMEFIGALCFFSVFIKDFGAGRAIFLSIFHAVSCFCSAGITLFGNSFQAYAHSYTAIFTATGLMLAGGIGFLTLYEFYEYFRNLRDTKIHHFSLQTKIVLYGSLISITVTTLLVYFLEHHHAFNQLTTTNSFIMSFFQAISFRSTGLLIVPIASLQLATLFLIMIISFIGSSPGSTGSGIRTTTVAIYIAVVRAAIEGHTAINIGHRRIAKDQVNKAIAILSLSIFWVVITIFSLLIMEPQWKFIDIIFEAFCAFTNLGLSTGITPNLSVFGKSLIMITMVIGRIGSLTLILALRKIALRKESAPTEIVYPEERIMLN